MTIIIETKNLTYRYPGLADENAPTLDHISLQIEQGEFVALIGANGSGKTTLARHFNALLIPTSGSVLIEGRDTRDTSQISHIRPLVGMVFQQPEDQIVASVVEEDVAFGPANYGIPPKEIHQRVETCLKAVGMWEHRLRPPHMLSAGQMQRVALAGILAMQPRCIIFDETTAMLDPQGRRNVLEIMSELNRQGITILFITHFMEEACFANRVIALHHGKVVLDGSPLMVFSQTGILADIGLERPIPALIADSLRTRLTSIPQHILTMEALLSSLPQFAHPIKSGLTPQYQKKTDQKIYSTNSGNIYIEVSSLSHTYLKDTPLAQLALDQFFLSAYKNDVYGLIGATGSGKSTLIQHLNGLLLPQEGNVRVGKYYLNSPDLDVISLRKCTGLVFQQPENQLFEQYVGDEIAYGLRLAGIKNKIAERVRWAMELVGLDFDEFKDRLTFTLSGGERRKVALASTLVLGPENLLLDEPTAGLDPQSRAELIMNLISLQESGLTLVICSHQMEDIASLAKKITVCSKGKDVLSGNAMDIFNRVDELHKFSLEPPAATKVADEFRKRGWQLPYDIINQTQLVSALDTWMQD